MSTLMLEGQIYAWEAVLIDLDTITAGDPTSPTQKSLMYDVSFEDSHKFDWRQFALLLSHIIEGDESDYHKRPPAFRHNTLEHSFKFGTEPAESSLLQITLANFLSLAQLQQ